MPKYSASVFTIPNVIFYWTPCLELSNSINTNNVLNKIKINELDRNDEIPVNHIDASIISDTNHTNIISNTSKIELLKTQMNDISSLSDLVTALSTKIDKLTTTSTQHTRPTNNLTTSYS